ncbi:unnamed protein product, partial [marine sediment metagenome]
TKVGETNLFFTTPFLEMNFDQGESSNFLIECLEDTVSQIRKLVCRLSFFNKYKKCVIFILPNSLIKKNNKFQHLKHLICDKSVWCSDIGAPEKNIPGIRIVFNDDLLQKKNRWINYKWKYIQFGVYVNRINLHIFSFLM